MMGDAIKTGFPSIDQFHQSSEAGQFFGGRLRDSLGQGRRGERVMNVLNQPIAVMYTCRILD
jgi:hypothetical protein